MKDFRFDDSFDDSFDDLDEEENVGYNQSPGEKKKIIKFIIIAVVSLVCGLSVYFVTDALLNGNSTPVVPTAQDIELELNDEMVLYLYDNITYSVKGLRNDKFFKADKVVVDDFTTQEKFYYALRYAVVSDFIDMTVSSDSLEEEENDTVEEDTDDEEAADQTEKKEEQKEEPKELTTYSISNSSISEYMYNFFGEDVVYSTDSPVNISVNFSKDGFNSGMLTYDATSDSFLVQFDSTSPSGTDTPLNPYLYKIDSAVLEGDTGNIIIKEKVVFTEVVQQTDEAGALIDAYDYKVYYDYSKSNLIEEKSGVTKSELTAIGIENYKDSAMVIAYTFFKDDNDEYHFLSSEISE